MATTLQPQYQSQTRDATTILDSTFTNMTSASPDTHDIYKFSTITAASLHNYTEFSNFSTTEFSNISTTEFSNISRMGFVEEMKKYPIFVVAHAINRYYLWVIFVFGFPGNIVSFITILRMKPVSSPTAYVAAVAFVDNMCLLVKFVYLILTKYDAPLENEGCWVLLFLGSFAAHFANWLLVAMTLERCLAICLPLKVGSICTRKLHIGGVVVTAVVLLAINSQAMVTTEMTNNKGDIQCEVKQSYQHFLVIWNWVDGAVFAIIPATLIIVMNALILHGIHRSAKIQRELTHKTSQMAETMRQQRQITIMLVVVCIAFVLLVAPLALYFAVKSYLSYEDRSLKHAEVLFINQLAHALADSTHAVNFYLYFFSNRRFRKRCIETLFCCCMPRRRSRRFRGSTVSGMSKTYRLSITDVTTVPQNAVQLTNISSSSSSSSNHHHIANGETKMTRLKGVRDCNF